MVVIWVPGAIFATTIEDRMLHDELAGYANYGRESALSVDSGCLVDALSKVR